MNTSPVVLLLILLLSACHGEEQIDSNASTISSTIKEQKKANTSLETSCPDPADIEPCYCWNEGALTMDCRYIQDDQQLWQVFSAHFPKTEFYEFHIEDNEGLKVLENGVFHNVSFKVIMITFSSLQVVEEEALAPSRSTLIMVWIIGCQLVTFPFERLPEFTSLRDLLFNVNHISSIPPLSSSTLETLFLDSNPISYLQPDVFKGLPVITSITLYYCQLTEITPGTFKDLPELNKLNLYHNNLSYIQSLTFDMVSPPGYTGFIDLGNNNIDFVEADAFQGVEKFYEISMEDNALTRLPERVWRPVLEKEINVIFKGNPLTCGCDVAWLVRNPQLLMGTEEAQCADGRYLTDLDPADFSMCG